MMAGEEEKKKNVLCGPVPVFNIIFRNGRHITRK